MLIICFLSVVLNAPFAAEVQTAYAQQDTEALRTLLDQASAQEDSFLVRYRLYPLTEDASLLEDLPSDLNHGTAREYALLSGLWSYKAGEASLLHVIQYGRRSKKLLDEATSRDPGDPYVLLVQGQSLLFRPAIAGRDPAAAAARFEELATHVDSVSGISELEANVWCWLALQEAGQSQRAATLHEDLLQQDLPPLYRQFLEDPPDV